MNVTYLMEAVIITVLTHLAVITAPVDLDFI